MKYSVCIDMMYADTDFDDRIVRAKDDGADAIEFWKWSNKDIDAIVRALDKTGLALSLLNLDSSDESLSQSLSRGILVKNRADELIEAINESAPVMKNLGVKNFKQVDMVKNGTLRDISERQIIRVYELFLLNDTVYALFRYQGTTAVTVELYRYEDGRFIYDNSWGSKIDAPTHIKYMVGASAVFKGRLFFTTAYLYATSDMSDLTWYENLTGTMCDLCVVNNKLYVLAYTKNDDGSYRMTVYENTDGSDDGFTEAFYFDYSAPAISLAYGDGCFYFGVGDINNVNEKNGMILSVEYEA